MALLLLVLVSIIRPVELRSSVWVDFHCPLAQEAMRLEIDRGGELYNTLVERNEKVQNMSTGSNITANIFARRDFLCQSLPA